MASLQDQLLKAGLGDKKKAKQINQEKRKKDKIKRKSKIVEVDSIKESVQAQNEAKKQKDRELNAKLKQEAESKAVQAQILQMISMNKQSVKNGEIEFNFTDNNVIKRLMVTEKLKDHLHSNKLAIVRFEEGYEIVPMPVADKIAERDADCILYRADAYEDVEVVEDENDWYADYQIPDDLTW